MTILWCGGEDIDFQQGAAPSVNTGGGYFRSGYARCALSSGNSGTVACISLPFSGGAVTSAWLHAQLYAGNYGSQRFVGLGLSSHGAGGVFIGSDSSSGSKLALWTWDGTTFTKLATETGASIPGGALMQLDMHIANHGSGATVNIYANGNATPALTYSGSTAITGIASLDCAQLIGYQAAGLSLSEVIVGDSDTRAFSLCTLAPNAAGDSAGSWTGAYSNINPTTINDASPIYNNATGSDFQANLTDLPTGIFTVQAVKVIARAEVTAGSTPTGVKIGVKTGGTVSVGSANTPGAAWTQYESLLATNPVSSAAWAQSDVNALQLDLQGA